jgi:two-component system, sensor histidine kinase
VKSVKSDDAVRRPLAEAVAGSSAEDSIPLQKRLFNEQVRLVFKTANPGVMHSILVAVVGWMYWNVADPDYLKLWLLLAFGISAVRVFIVWAFVRQKPEGEELVLWDRVYLAAVFVTGIIWGLAGILLYPPDDIVYQVALAFVVGGISASATASLSARHLAIWLAVSPAMFLLSMRFLLDPSDGHLEMGILLVLYFAVLMNIGRSMHKQVLEALSLRFENQELVQSLETSVKELDFARLEAEQSSRAKTRFLASASHDLRQPVHALRLFVAALARQVAIENDERGLIKKINRSMDSMSALLDTLLDVSKLDAGVVQPRIEKIDLEPLLLQIANEFAVEAEEKGLYFRVVSARYVIESDPVLLGRVIRNLVSNAVRYTETGGILVGARPRGATTHIEVWDSGLGIPAENHDEIFQEFFQMRQPSDDRQGGLGLGLAIVKRTCDLLGHTLELKSITGRGTRFSIVVPRASGRPPSDLGAAMPMPNFEAFGEGYKVLLVEDDPLSAEAMIELLQSWGFSCAHALTYDAIALALKELENAPSLIISDFRLPNSITGEVAVAHAFSEIGHKVPALIITGDTAPDRLQVLDGTGFPLLHKPVQPAQLRSVIRHLLEN